jgi:Ni/Fe-hydrogenase 1 B-type cytochrome subunit
MLKKIYVWEAPVRVTHWLNVLCLLVLAFTGVYIGRPFISGTGNEEYIMGWCRFIHYATAYVFVVSVAVRIYWAFAGNRYASWRAFFPFISAERIKGMFRNFLFYSLVRKKPVEETGHTPLAGLTYLFVFLMYLVQAITGFALYSLYEPSGIMHSTFGWWFLLFSIPGTRLIHHVIMWLLLYFAIIHVYIALFLGKAEKNGLVGSIFDGYKFMEGEKAE